jgi:hypothetical protein
LRARLVGDAALVALLGGERVWDEPPRGEVPPYVTFGESGASDWPRGGQRLSVSLVAWSSQGGDAETLAILDRAAALCADPPLTLDGHRLVLLAVTGTQVPRPDKTGLRRAVLRLSALTEPL